MWCGKCASDSQLLAALIRKHAREVARAVFETGPLSVWFVERAGSSVGGGVDGGADVDTYRVALSGDRSGIGTRTGFEQLPVTGNGTLALTLDQSFDSVALAGTGLTLSLNGNSVGAVSGSDAAETLSVDGDIARIALGGGNDTLALGTAIANGSYVGGAGSDTLRFTNTAPVTLAGNASGLKNIPLTGNTLNISGTLGATGDVMTLSNGAQVVTLANGGTINGTLNLGEGNTSFSLAPAARSAAPSRAVRATTPRPSRWRARGRSMPRR